MPEQNPPPEPPAIVRALIAKVAWMRPVVAWVVRAATVCCGAYVEYHEVFVAEEAQWLRIFVGLWLMAVPPALWLDSLRRLALAAATAPASPVAPASPSSPSSPEAPASQNGRHEGTP